MGRKRMYAKWDVAVKEVEDVLRNEFKLKGLKEVRIVWDRQGSYDNINVIVDGRVLDNGVKWDIVRRHKKYYRGCWELVWGYSLDFSKKLEEYLDKKDESILKVKCWNGEVGKKKIVVSNSNGSLDWMYNIMEDKGIEEIGSWR